MNKIIKTFLLLLLSSSAFGVAFSAKKKVEKKPPTVKEFVKDMEEKLGSLEEVLIFSINNLAIVEDEINEFHDETSKIAGMMLKAEVSSPEESFTKNRDQKLKCLEESRINYEKIIKYIRFKLGDL